MLKNQDNKPQILYRLWKGSKKVESGGRKSSGRCLKQKYRFSGSNDQVTQVFQNYYGGLEIPLVRIYLPYESPEQVFDPWLCHFDQKLGLIKQCDGETIVRQRVVPPGGGNAYYSQVQSPCRRGEHETKCQECSYRGEFYFYVRELVHAGSGFGRMGKMTLSGYHDVVGLSAMLQAFYDRYGSLSKSPYPLPETMGMIPYVLTRSQQTFTREATDRQGNKQGFRQQQTYWAISIAEDPEFLKVVELYQRQKQFEELARSPALQLPEIAEKFGIDPKALPPAQIPEPIEEEVLEPELIEEEDPWQHRLNELWAEAKSNGLTPHGLKVYVSSLTGLDGKPLTSSSQMSPDQIDFFQDLIQDPAFIEELNQMTT